MVSILNEKNPSYISILVIQFLICASILELVESALEKMNIFPRGNDVFLANLSVQFYSHCNIILSAIKFESVARKVIFSIGKSGARIQLSGQQKTNLL